MKTVEEMKKDISMDECLLTFDEKDEFGTFLDVLTETDEEVELKLNTIKTFAEEGELKMTAATTAGPMTEIKVSPYAIRTLEKRSGDTAIGHDLMKPEQILASMNNYWPLHGDKKKVCGKIRGGKLLSLGSEQYVFIEQSDMIKAVEERIETRHPGAIEFLGATYTHQITEVRYGINDAISATYKNAWRKSGLPETLLDQSKVYVRVYTSDTGDCAAKAIYEMDVAGTRFLLGHPVEVVHRNGHGGIESFIDALEKVDTSIEQEMKALADLMGVTLMHPCGAVVKALKKAKIDKISKKACKELIENMFFGVTESAYLVYMFLHGVLDTSYGSALSDERKLRIITALNGLLYEDWSKLDVETEAEI